MGYYCPAGTVSPLPCPIGTYGDAIQLSLATECKPCPAGKYCNQMALTTADLVNKDCHAGYICLGSSIVPNPNDGTLG
jgi:hypothetical protein